MATATGRLVNHALYEYGKGVRALFMITMDRRDLAPALLRLSREAVDHHIHEADAQHRQGKVNLFFGRPALVGCVRALVRGPLGDLSAHEDFMLGTLLGYDREQQCRRFLERVGVAGRQSVLTAPEEEIGFADALALWRETAALC